MIFFDTVPPCAAYFSGGTACDFDSQPIGYYGAYYNLIAVFGSDFNPADQDDSTIKYALTDDKIVVEFTKFNLYGSVWQGYTFSCEIHASGHIRIHFDSVCKRE